MAGISLPSFSGGVATHVVPLSDDRSKCTRQPSCSVLDPDRMSPFASCTGLFLIGPSTPSGRRRADAHVRPPSADVMTMPHHVLGLGPTL